MALYPGAVQRLLPESFVPRVAMAAYNRINFHVTAGRGSPFSTFNKPGASSSHFCVLKDGTVEQFIDTAFRGEADLDGNDATISIETEGGYPANVVNSEPWTQAQVDALIALSRWLVETHGIKAKLATDSKIGESSHGFSWHRLGIDGNFDAAHPGRKQLGGGMRYSKATGKTCPGNAKIDQIPGILAAVTGGAVPVSNPVPAAPAPAPAAAPRPTAPDGQDLLDVDGDFGPRTKARLQQLLGVGIDGIVGPVTIAALQRFLMARGFSVGAAAADGILGPKTTKALQRYLGVTADGVWGPITTRALQARLNTAHL